MSLCHWNVLPASNLKPWTTDQRKELVAAIHAVGYETTQRMVKMVGKYFESVEVAPERGLRIINK